MAVTSIGLQEDYKSELIANLRANDIYPHGKESIKQLELMLKNSKESTEIGRRNK